MTGRRRGGRSRREQHSRTFYVCFPWQTFHGIPRRSAERAARKTNCLLPNRLFSSIQAYIYDLLPLFLPEVERWETGQLFANPDAWHVRRTRKHSLLFLRRDNTRLCGCPRNFDRHFRDFRFATICFCHSSLPIPNNRDRPPWEYYSALRSSEFSIVSRFLLRKRRYLFWRKGIL